MTPEELREFRERVQRELEAASLAARHPTVHAFSAADLAAAGALHACYLMQIGL